MRWIALWLLLTGVHVAGWAVARQVSGGGSEGKWLPGAETLVHFAVVPPMQVLALWVVATVRHAKRDQQRDQRAGTPDR